VSGLARLTLWLRALLRRGRVESELDRELRLHLELETEENIRRGMPPGEARRRALVSFGGVEQTKEAVRDERETRWLDEISADVRYALRGFRRQPWFAATAVLLLALGIGANVAIFSVVHRLILRPLPFPDGNRMVFLQATSGHGALSSGSRRQFVDQWRARARDVVDAAGVTRRAGDCLLAIWPPPLYETNTCGSYVARGTLLQKNAAAAAQRARSSTSRGSRPTGARDARPTNDGPPVPLTLPEDLLAMDASEFRDVLRSVLREELGAADPPLGARWEGGEMILKPGREGTAEKRIPLDSLFHKVVMIRDKLRVLEQKINAHGKLTDEEKVQLQGYVTGCYGSLTTFNVLFAEKADGFTGQKGDE